jgi:hypothetical protein
MLKINTTAPAPRACALLLPRGYKAAVTLFAAPLQQFRALRAHVWAKNKMEWEAVNPSRNGSREAYELVHSTPARGSQGEDFAPSVIVYQLPRYQRMKYHLKEFLIYAQSFRAAHLVYFILGSKINRQE